MTNERMLELILLNYYIDQYYTADSCLNNMLVQCGLDLNDNIFDRRAELEVEFLKPYVIDNTSKED